LSSFFFKLSAVFKEVEKGGLSHANGPVRSFPVLREGPMFAKTLMLSSARKKPAGLATESHMSYILY